MHAWIFLLMEFHLSGLLSSSASFFSKPFLDLHIRKGPSSSRKISSTWPPSIFCLCRYVSWTHLDGANWWCSGGDWLVAAGEAPKQPRPTSGRREPATTPSEPHFSANFLCNIFLQHFLPQHRQNYIFSDTFVWLFFCLNTIRAKCFANFFCNVLGIFLQHHYMGHILSKFCLHFFCYFSARTPLEPDLKAFFSTKFLSTTFLGSFFWQQHHHRHSLICLTPPGKFLSVTTPSAECFNTIIGIDFYNFSY